VANVPGGTPSDTVTGPDSFGSPSDAGSATTFSRGDHDHGLPSGVESVNGMNGVVTIPGPPVLFGIGSQVPGAALASFVNEGLGTMTPVPTLFDGAPLAYWQALQSQGDVMLAGAIANANNTGGMFIGKDLNFIYRSTDGGQTWTGIATPWDTAIPDAPLQIGSFAFGPGNLVLCVGWNWLINYAIVGLSTDGGQTWTDISTDTPLVGASVTQAACAYDGTKWYLCANPGFGATPATVTADSAPTLPVTIVTGVNDQFRLSGNHGNETFTIAAGVYTTLGDLKTAVGAATGNYVPGDLFSFWVTTTDNGTNLVFTLVAPGASGNGVTIIEGNGGAAAIGVTSPPDIFAGGGGSPAGLWTASSPTGPWTPQTTGLDSEDVNFVVATPDVAIAAGGAGVALVVSTDNGSTWADNANPFDGTGAPASLVTDGAGNWLAWAGAGFLSPFLVQSLDNGATWGTPVLLPAFAMQVANVFLSGTGWVTIWGRVSNVDSGLYGAGAVIIYSAPVAEPLVITPTGYVADNIYAPLALVPV
jgi:hypothetical protein